jgi:hypothetical protein
MLRDFEGHSAEAATRIPPYAGFPLEPPPGKRTVACNPGSYGGSGNRFVHHLLRFFEQGLQV